ncbi:hypothetical protein SAMN05660703_2551 [Cellulophaga tyrosinoxydans]|uniref:Uncharacterized protein n=1 Tax=Cellulophaga tyrosinoxydans TaxID=504486 RepID=A0A1W2BNC9_9FLAO|nr:hypothetical protein SAMN05660703_2551 [Cellulophaga tyrosinoxydans]
MNMDGIYFVFYVISLILSLDKLKQMTDLQFIRWFWLKTP